MKQTAIQSANLEFNAEGTPVSRDFDDVYFSNDNGLEETRYVFLGGNGIPERFVGHPRSLFVVAESGFGTGLNFLTLWQAFDAFRRASPQATLERLHFISFEKFPLTKDDLRLAHQHWPELAPWAAMARLARPGATLATFTSAGFVRRGLQDAGFSMRKSKGFGRKREMLTGVMESTTLPALRTPWFARTGTEKRAVAIVGGGIASALLSLALLRRGWQVTLYCADGEPAQGASGNRQGALYPLLSAHDPALAHFFPAAFTFARRLYDALPVDFDHDWCGVTQLGYDEKSQQKISQMLTLDLPDAIAHAVSAEAVAQMAGVETGCGGIHYPAGGWLCPAQLTAAALALAQRQGLCVHYDHPVTSLVQQGGEWRLEFADGSQCAHACVVLANGHRISHFAQTEKLPVYPVGGQVSHIPTTAKLGELRQVLCYDGYLTPQNPHNQHHCIGASYHRGQEETAYSEEDQQQNRQRLLNCFPQAQWAKDVDVSGGEARCGVRCATRDHLPLVGNVADYAATLNAYAHLAEERTDAVSAPVYDGLFMLGALGSRGLCSAPLAAEILASQMSQEPLPLDGDTLAALNPNRLWVRKLLKGKQVK